MTPEWRERLAEGAGLLGLEIGAPEGERLSAYADLLLHWGTRIDLISTPDPQAVLEKHLLDSLTALPWLEGPGALVDLGSGAGLPGLVLALAKGGALSLRSVESRGKRATFQRRVVAELGIKAVVVDQRRAELVIRTEPAPRWVSARALAPLKELVALGGPWLERGSRLLVYKGPKVEEELAGAGSEMESIGVGVLRRRDLSLPWSGAKRTLLEIGRSADDHPTP